MKKILITTFALALAAPALAAQQDIAQLSAVTASREALRTAVNTQLSAVQANFDEVYAVIDAGPVYVNASAPSDTKVVWIDTDQDNAIKVHIGGVWTVVGSGGGDLGSATYPSAAGVANWDGSAWGTSYTVGTGASNLVQLNGSAQLPAVSGALLTGTFTGTLIGSQTTIVGGLQTIATELDGQDELLFDSDDFTETAGTGTVTVSIKRTEYIGWSVVNSDTATSVADGKMGAVVPAGMVGMNGMNLVDFTCSVADLNSAASGATTVVLRRVRGGTAADMTSTGVTIEYGDYTASDEVIDTSNDDLATGDKLYVDIKAVTTAAQKGLHCTATFEAP